MTKKIHLCRMLDGRVIGNIQSIKCDGPSILDAFANKKSGEYLLFDDKLEQIGSFSDHGMSFEDREIGEMLKETIDEMRTPEQDAVPLIRGEGMLVVMNGYLEVFNEEERNVYAIEADGMTYPVELFDDPDPDLIDEYVTLVGTMRVIDGKPKVIGNVKEHDGSVRRAHIFGAGKIDVENKMFIADMEDDYETSVRIDMDEDALIAFSNELDPDANQYISGPLYYDGKEYLFRPRAIIQASMTSMKEHAPEMGMMS